MLISIAALFIMLMALTAVLALYRRQIGELKGSVRDLELAVARLTQSLALLRNDLDELEDEIADSGFFELAELEVQAEQAWVEGVNSVLRYGAPGKRAE